MNASNSFDLKVLKGLLNFKFNKNPFYDLTTLEKKRLCLSYKEGGTLHINPEYISKIWPRARELKHNMSDKTLDLLCGQLYENYRWNDLLNDLIPYRPANIPAEKSYMELNEQQRGIVDDAFRNFFDQLTDYHSFVSMVIKKEKMKRVLREDMNKIATGPHDIVLREFIKRIYIELTTRKAAILFDEENDVIEEVYDSWYKLFSVIRDELKSLPASILLSKNIAHLNVLEPVQQILNNVLRSHLTTHQAKFRHWYKNAKSMEKNKKTSPQQLQKEFPTYELLIDSIKHINQELLNLSVLLMKRINSRS